MWESQVRSIQQRLCEILAQAGLYGRDTTTGKRAAILETAFVELEGRLKELSDQLTYCNHKFRFDPLRDVEDAPYVVACRGGDLYFLYAETEEEQKLGHQGLLERRGFKKSDSLGGGFVTMEAADVKVVLRGFSTSLGPDRVRSILEETLTGAILAITYPGENI